MILTFRPIKGRPRRLATRQSSTGPIRRSPIRFRTGWPPWLWWLGRILVRHHNPFTDTWHLTPFGEGFHAWVRRAQG